MRSILASLLVLSAPALLSAATPNVLLLYADDLGYGDVSCYGSKTISTPNIDRLAASGLRFTDGHAPAATCTPSRYAMLTGEYAFRKKGTGILPGDAKLIIEPGRTTMATVLKHAGYRTGVIGKWHLGLGSGGMDWNGKIGPGPLEIGFDHCYIMAATGDRVPCVYVNDHRIVGIDPADPIEVSYKAPFPGQPTGKANPELLRVHPSHGHDQFILNGISRIGHMKGGKSALWKDEDMADVFTQQAVDFITAGKDKPFFLYFAAHDPHVPRAPHPRFVGKSGMGPRGDAILQFDACVGRLLDTLDQHGLAENTLVILSSDNGPVVDDGYQDEAVEKLGNHSPAGALRGGKYSAFEGGTRVPFIVRWPARVKAGVSDALVCQVDFPATFAALTGQDFKEPTAPDSVNVLPALLGESKTGRDHLVVQAGPLALREGTWKYIEPAQGPKKNKNTNSETGSDPAGQLYDLATDLGEKKNLSSEQAERAAKMAAKLKELRGVVR
jgi:arylsulfatase A-like enzyme